MWKEFKAFLVKDNIIGLAIAVILGLALNKLVTSVVDDLIMPIVNLATSATGGSWKDWYIPLTSAGAEGPKMLVGNIIAVSWPEVTKTAALYGGIGLFHYIFRKPFLTISLAHDDPDATGLNVRLWDFLFYASFGFVVTSSVSIAGVLLVFCYLIVPSVAAMLYADTVGRRLAIGWTMGTVVSAVGVYLSLVLDLPTGATIVCTFGVVLLLMAAVRPLLAPGRVAVKQQATANSR